MAEGSADWVPNGAGASHRTEVLEGERFEFGRNWQAFLESLDDERIEVAQRSVANLLGLPSLAGMSFLDAGSGSGLFSLAARKLGARVCSFDFDPGSVACTRSLRDRFFSGDANWSVREGSILDRSFVESLGRFDVVYSWGVLHHTGELWKALENAALAVAPRGRFAVAIYNDQGWPSRWWHVLKKRYNHSSPQMRRLLVMASVAFIEAKGSLGRLARGENPLSLAEWATYRSNRGMSLWHDIVDWVGGYPFEVAKPEEVFAFLHERGFALENLKTCGGGKGCNEFVFSRGLVAAPSTRA